MKEFSMVIQRKRNAIHVYFMTCLGVLLSFQFFSCGTTEPTDDIPAIKIVLPELDYEYESYNTIYLVAQFDKRIVASFIEWNFSIDSGKTWEQMSLSEKILPTSQKTDDENIGYTAHGWKPEKDSVFNREIYIKAYDYDVQTIFDKKGPYKIL